MTLTSKESKQQPLNMSSGSKIQQNKVLLITPHFGSLPKWILLTFATFAQNPSFSLLVITDQNVEDFPKYPNISFSSHTLSSFERLCSQTIGTEVNIKKGYKICDLRPAFGLIFASYIQNYQYWGHIDLDTFWGNIEGLLKPILEQDYDIIPGYPHHVGGPFCLYKNTIFLNNLFKENPNYVDVFKIEKNVDFDEIGIKDIQYRGFDWTVRLSERQGKLKIYRDRQLYLQDIDSSWWLQETQRAVASAGLEGNSTDAHPFEFGTGFWKMGKITALANDSQKEYLFYHFLDGKQRLFQPFSIRDCDRVKSFTIGLDGIELKYGFGFSWLRHEWEKIATKILRFVIYDLGPLRHKLNLSLKPKS